MAAGGARKWHMERLMQLWSRRFTGAVPSYVRTRIAAPAKTLEKTGAPARGTASTPLAVWTREDDSTTKGRTMSDIYCHVSREGLSEEEQATLDDFLNSAASVGYLGGEPKATIRGYIARDVRAETMAKVIASNALCTALFDAAEHLSDEDIMASEWMVRQARSYPRPVMPTGCRSPHPVRLAPVVRVLLAAAGLLCRCLQRL
jgi:hypothetical protein